VDHGNSLELHVHFVKTLLVLGLNRMPAIISAFKQDLSLHAALVNFACPGTEAHPLMLFFLQDFILVGNL